jgi:metal-responsive CopG/Arc/MetJ family transcriptional regulator
MSRLSVSISDRLLQEAKELSRARTKRETIERALRELIRQERLRQLRDWAGSGLVDMDLKELTTLREGK